MATKKATKDPLDELANGDPGKVIALMLWKNRLREPDLYVQITEADIKGFEDCVKYLKVTASVKIEHPQGLPAQDAVPATANRRAIPGRPAAPPKPFVIVTLVDQHGDGIRPVENNQDDYDAAQAATQVRKARDQAQELAGRLLAQARSGEYSLSDMQDAADALLTLARAA